ncbi:MAG: TonB-dependent receptor [Bacteroidota bacterium]
MEKKIILFIVWFFCFAQAYSQNQYTISGTVSDSVNGETTIGALVYVNGTTNGVVTNVYGFYSLTLPEGTYDIVISYLGYKTQTRHIDLKSNVTLNPKLKTSESTLKEVVVSAEANKEKEQIRSTQMSTISIPIEQIKNIPTIGGETDIIKVMQLMPGVKRGGEGQNQMFVRGGSGDDNLILLDEAVVYNISHLFGFFSVFNNDALKDVTMIKGGFPAQYGGRLSSVMDIRMKDGDMQKYHVDGGIGTLSSHITIQGPIIKDRMSFIVSGRRSYIDQLFKLIYKDDVLPYFFYDATCKLNYRVSDKDRLYFSTYYGNDVLKADTKSDTSFFDGGFKLGNITSTLRWNHLFNEKLFSNLSFIYTRFRYDVEAAVPGNSFLAKSKISDLGMKYDFSYFKNARNAIKYGVLFTNHNFRPNVVNTSGQISEVLKSKEGDLISTQEIAAYINHEYDPFARLKINYGLRLSTLVTNAVYFNPEPRISAAFTIKENQSVKLSYSRMFQYLHLVSSSAIALPTDLWYPVTAKVKPQKSDQVALGYNYLFEKIKTTVSLEGYYKKMQNLVEYREGAVLLLNDNYEDELVKGTGEAYGFEFFVQKMSGRLTGWIGYTISWSTRKFPDLNRGKTFYAKNDRRHDVSVVASYDFTKRISASVVWVFSTGQRFTPVTGYFAMPNSSLTHIDLLPIYADKNSQQLPASHRLDISIILKSRLDRKYMKWTGEWHVGAYNVYNRAQPYRVEVVGKDDGSFKYQAKGLFGFIPFVAYNFKF